MMLRLIESGRLQSEHIEALVEVLADFYQRAESGDAINRFGTAAAIGVNVLENFSQTEAFIGQEGLTQDRFALISEYARRFLRREELFLHRIAGGYIRDCHGDLYSANICLADKVYIYDCIEFNERFRYCDVASDVAFLAMDLDFHGLETFSRQFIEDFSRKTTDPGLAEVINFYKCYRAVVRGKIGLFTANDPAVDESVRIDCRAKAAQYFQLAARYAAA
jgi:aminoglycoside phosphotransferase family enzyme